MMSIHRSRFLCSLIACLLLAGTSLATEPVRIPTENTLEDLQLFAPVESNAMSDRPYLKEGFFFTWDHLYWSVAAPRNALVGVPGPQQVFDINRFRILDTFSNIDTSEFQDIVHTGNRYEFGHMYDNCGWMAGLTDMNSKVQEFVHGDATVLFDDPRGLIDLAFVPSPRFPNQDADLDGDHLYGRFGEDQLSFRLIQTGFFTFIVQPFFDGIAQDNFPNGDIPDTVGPGPAGQGDLVPVKRQFIDITVRNETEFWAAELMTIRRLDRWFLGGHIDAMAGVRYQSFDEEFLFRGLGRDVVGGGIGVVSPQPTLDDTQIFSEAENNIIGPQIAARWFKTCCRSTFATEMRFSPAINFQSVRMRTMLAGQVDGTRDLVSPLAQTQDQVSLSFENAGNDSLTGYKFSPIGELRLNYSYQLTRAIALRVGYNATYIGGLARPSNMVVYRIPDPQIKKENYLDDAFMQGINVGFEVNR